MKFGWKQYCSKKCLSQDKVTSIELVCEICKKTFLRKPSQIKRSESGKYFCSQACAAIFNNRIRNANRPIYTCNKCNNKIPKSQKYCSRACAGFSRRKDRRDTEAKVINKIRDFYNLNNRIPVKKEMNDIYKNARTLFGTWNKAIEVAGFDVNPVMFAKKYIARDGHRCDSLAEKVVDEWFSSKKIPHQRSVAYPSAGRMTCDFVVGKFFIEFFGLEGVHKEYARLVNEKRKLSKKHNLNLIELKPNHLFPRNKLDEVLAFLIQTPESDSNESPQIKTSCS